MKNIMTLVILLCGLSLSVSANQQKLTYKQFGHLPMIQYPTVSPDGKSTVALYNSAEGPLVVVSAFGNTDIATIARLKKSKDRIDGITWANNERIIISASYSKLLLGDRIRVSRLFAVNKDGTDLRILQRRNTKKKPSRIDLLSSSRIVSLLKNDKEHVLLQLWDERDKGQAIFKVNIYDGNFDKLFVNNYDVDNWYANKKGDVVFGVGYDPDKDEETIWYRENNKTTWKKLHSRKGSEGATFNPIMVKNGKAIVISDHDLYRKALWQYDIKNDKFEKLLYSNDKYDVDAALMSPEGDEVIGAVYFEHYRKNHYFSDSDKVLSQIVKNSFKQYHTSIVDFSRDRKKVLILAQRDDSAPKYFWLDLTKRKGGFWFGTYPYLAKAKLAHVEPFEFAAKDGMKLNGYLTMPIDIQNNEKPPLVIFPHGGPVSRDYQYFDPFVQFFASQGYAVLQVNFRGSKGFGNSYETKGYRQWGKAMQQDVYSAIGWLAEQNKVDMDKACLVGASYGGYVALTAAFQRPKQFKCIASIAGISSLNDLVEDDYKYGYNRTYIVDTIGDPTDKETAQEFESLSAINFIQKIKAPILLIHGTHDTQVNFSQSSSFNDKAKKAGLDIEYIQFKNGTHYLDLNENRLATFQALGEFLKKHL